jgi:TonB family protein
MSRGGATLLALSLALAAPAAAQLEPQPTDFGEEEKKKEPPKQRTLVQPPEFIGGPEIPYPEAAQEEGRGGALVARITIDAAGGVSRVDVLESTGHLDLDWAAMGAISNFTFKPAMFDDGSGTPSPGPVAIDYRTVFEVRTVVEEVPTEDALPEPADAPLDEGDDPMARFSRGPVNLEGLVRAAALKTPLEGVEVYVAIPSENVPGYEPGDEVELATLTDEEGRFTFRNLPPGPVRVSLGSTGYLPAFVEETIAEKQRTQVIVYLKPEKSNEFETVIRERKARKEVSKIALTREEVRRIPGTFGDPIRVIQNLPGLARAPGLGGQLIVRGANPQDTGTYFDGVEIPLLYHFGGLTSVVNAEFLEDISFYPGGFGAYYGRATAGIVDVSSRRLNMSEYKGYAEVDLFDSGFFFGGPLKIGQLPTVNFALAARRSYVDALLPIVLDIFVGPDGQGIVVSPIYWDYQLKLETSPWAGHHLSLFGFGSDDDLKVISQGLGQNDFDLGFKTTFHRLVGKWESRFPGGITHTFQPFIGAELGAIQAGSGDIGVGVNIDITTLSWGLRDELRWAPSEIFEFAAGIDYQAQTFGIAFDVPIPSEVGSFPRLVPRITGQNQVIETSGITNATALYSEAIIDLFPNFRVVPGLRAEATNVHVNEQEGADGASVPSSDVWLWNVDPRLTGRLTLVPGSVLKGAFGVYRQPPSGNQITEEGGNPALFQPRALQYIVGFEQKLTRDLNLDVQAYYTGRDLLVQSTNELISVEEGDVKRVAFTNGGRGRTLGVELLLRHELSKNFFGWIAYTLSRSEIDLSESSESFRLTSFDQTHILTLVGQYNLPWDITFGARFRLVSGRPTTLPLGSVHDLDTTNYNRRSSAGTLTRFPTFHQLDLRLDKKWVFDTFSLTAYVDLLNAYNQENPEQFQEDYRNREVEPLPGLPILPILGMSGEF